MFIVIVVCFHFVGCWSLEQGGEDGCTYGRECDGPYGEYCCHRTIDDAVNKVLCVYDEQEGYKITNTESCECYDYFTGEEYVAECNAWGCMIGAPCSTVGDVCCLDEFTNYCDGEHLVGDEVIHCSGVGGCVEGECVWEPYENGSPCAPEFEEDGQYCVDDTSYIKTCEDGVWTDPTDCVGQGCVGFPFPTCIFGPCDPGMGCPGLEGQYICCDSTHSVYCGMDGTLQEGTDDDCSVTVSSGVCDAESGICDWGSCEAGRPSLYEGMVCCTSGDEMMSSGGVLVGVKESCLLDCVGSFEAGGSCEPELCEPGFDCTWVSPPRPNMWHCCFINQQMWCDGTVATGPMVDCLPNSCDLDSGLCELEGSDCEIGTSCSAEGWFCSTWFLMHSCFCGSGGVVTNVVLCEPYSEGLLCDTEEDTRTSGICNDQGTAFGKQCNTGYCQSSGSEYIPCGSTFAGYLDSAAISCDYGCVDETGCTEHPYSTGSNCDETCVEYEDVYYHLTCDLSGKVESFESCDYGCSDYSCKTICQTNSVHANDDPVCCGTSYDGYLGVPVWDETDSVYTISGYSDLTFCDGYGCHSIDGEADECNLDACGNSYNGEYLEGYDFCCGYSEFKLVNIPGMAGNAVVEDCTYGCNQVTGNDLCFSQCEIGSFNLPFQYFLESQCCLDDLYEVTMESGIIQSLEEECVLGCYVEEGRCYEFGDPGILIGEDCTGNRCNGESLLNICDGGVFTEEVSCEWGCFDHHGDVDECSEEDDIQEDAAINTASVDILLGLFF